jgi:hypothetical protein
LTRDARALHAQLGIFKMLFQRKAAGHPVL